MPTPTYTALATRTLTGTAASVTFSSIPATYRDLILVTDATITAAGSTDGYGLRFNGDTGSNYFYVRMVGTGSAAQSAQATTTFALGGVIGDVNKGLTMFQIMDYSATDKHKTVITRSNGGFANWTQASASRWANTAAITSVLLRSNSSYNFSIGSTFSLYGVIA
jgi:hypothetical protein